MKSVFAVLLVAGSSLSLAACTAGPMVAPTTAPTHLRVLAYNIKHGRGMDGTVDLERIAAVIRAQSPDVVALQEVDVRCRRSGGIDQPRVLGELCGMRPVFGEIRPYDGGRYGMAVLSRHPIVDSAVVGLPADGPRFALEVRIAMPGGGGEIVVTGLHLYRTEEQRLAQARVLVERYVDTARPVVLAGDFNSERGSPVMRLLERTWSNPGKDDPSNTFPADAPRKEIDFALVRPGDGLAVQRSVVVPEAMASDHRPILLELLVMR